MTMKSNTRKLLLISHITFSVGWIGAVVVFLVLAISGLTTKDPTIANATFYAMKMSTWYVIVPFSISSLFTGIIQAVGTNWGLFKYYWIVVKLFLTVLITLLLLSHLQPISDLADSTSSALSLKLNKSDILIDLIIKAGAAIIALLTIITISVYKPWGKVKPLNKDKNQHIKNEYRKKTIYFLLFSLLLLITIFVVMHL